MDWIVGLGRVIYSGTKDKIWQINEAGNWGVVSSTCLLINPNFASKYKNTEQFRTHPTKCVHQHLKAHEKYLIRQEEILQSASCLRAGCQSCKYSSSGNCRPPPCFSSPWHGAARADPAFRDWGRAACSTEEWACQSAPLGIAGSCRKNVLSAKISGVRRAFRHRTWITIIYQGKVGITARRTRGSKDGSALLPVSMGNHRLPIFCAICSDSCLLLLPQTHTLVIHNVSPDSLAYK